MTKIRKTFLKPRFKGKRFEGRRLPVQVLPELSAYSQLVEELAKHIFLRENQDRQRVPKGFTLGFSLALTDIEDGSAVAVMERIHEPSLLPPDADYFEKARDLINETIESVGSSNSLPKDFPPEILQYFDRFGRVLRDDESIELCLPEKTTGAQYNRTVRKNLSLLRSSTYQQEAELIGKVVEADVNKSSFQVETDDGVVQAHLPDNLEEEILSALKDHHRLDVCLRGISTFDRQDRLQRVDEILEFTQFESIRPFAKRLDELRKLTAGWLDGNGQPVSQQAHNTATVFKDLLEQYDVPVPHLYPTPEGGLQLEWSVTNSEFDLDVTGCINDDGSIIWIWTSKDTEKEAETSTKEISQEELLSIMQRTGLIKR